jgi:hypothetical protein
MPYIDASPDLPYFKAIQKIGATGILKGTGIPYKWANQTWFYPDSLITETEFSNGLSAFTGKIYKSSNEILTIKKFIQLLELTTLKESFYAQIKNEWINTGLSFFSENRPIKRFEIAVILDKYLQPFETNIDYKGNFRKNKTK